MSEIKISVATHKQYEFPSDEMYVPIHVGKAINNIDLGILGDDKGDNISEKNPTFCELTALYWAWKNSFFDDSKYCGLVHYRRFFKGYKSKLKDQYIASQDEILNELKDVDVIIPKKRNYYVETIDKHYKNAHHEKDLIETRKIILEKYPDFVNSFDVIMNQKKLHLFNMFVMKKELFYEYCEWLFSIIFELEKRIDISNYSPYQKRVFGFIAERMFNVWVLNKKLKVKELKTINIDGENLFVKAYGLLKRKFTSYKL